MCVSLASLFISNLSPIMLRNFFSFWGHFQKFVRFSHIQFPYTNSNFALFYNIFRKQQSLCQLFAQNVTIIVLGIVDVVVSIIGMLNLHVHVCDINVFLYEQLYGRTCVNFMNCSSDLNSFIIRYKYDVLKFHALFFLCFSQFLSNSLANEQQPFSRILE